MSFLLIGSGRVQVSHTGAEGLHAVIDVHHGMIVGEIALMRETTRTATVTALDEVTGWVGAHEAFATMLDVPGMMNKLVRLARQRLATFVAPIPMPLRVTPSCICGRCCPATTNVPSTGRSSSPAKRSTGGSSRPANPRRG